MFHFHPDHDMPIHVHQGLMNFPSVTLKKDKNGEHLTLSVILSCHICEHSLIDNC